MPALLTASFEPHEGRTTVTAALGALLAEAGRSVRLLRVRAPSGTDPAAEDDARVFAAVPGCQAPSGAVTEQEASVAAQEAQGDAVVLIEGQPGVPSELAQRLGARVVIVSAQADEERLAAVASAAQTLGEAFVGVVFVRQPERARAKVTSAVEARGLPLLGVLPEDRLLAHPTVRELAEALHASRLVDGGDEDEAVEYIMLGPISSDPGQPYFMSHPHKAVINRADKMDLHLAALATEPACLVLTSGALNPTTGPYLLDRVAGSGLEISVLLCPEGTVRAVELVDELYTRTRFAGRRKLERALKLARAHLTVGRVLSALS